MYNNYNYNIPQFRQNMYNRRNNDQRLIGGGFFGPLLLGGVAGFALGNNRPNYNWGYQRPFYNPYYYNNYYYNPYYY